MKLARFLSGFAPALALAVMIGFAAPSIAQSPSPDASASSPAAAAPAATASSTPAAAATPAAAPAAAAPPSCSATVTDKCVGNSGDTAWMLTSVALVLMMTIPGLGLFYGGMVRKKNVGDTVMTSFAITCLVTVIYAVLTYSLAFTGGSPFIGGLSRALLQGIHYDMSQRLQLAQRLGADDPRDRLHVLPDDVRDHHSGADRRRLRGAHEVLGDAVVHRPVGDLRLRAGRALGLGSGRHVLDRQRRRQGQLHRLEGGSRLRRRHGGSHRRGRRGSGRGA